jgi:hypothetical protein
MRRMYFIFYRVIGEIRGYGIAFQKAKEKNDTVRLIIAIENDQLLALPIAETRYIINSMNDIIEIICRINFIRVGC